MIIEASQEFTIQHPGGVESALVFVRSPEVALAAVRFLKELRVVNQELVGQLLVKAPALGEIDLPFKSALVAEPRGATLQPVALSSERVWVAVAGQALVSDQAVMTFQFHFTGHLSLPDTPGWGGVAFEKMVNAAAQRTLSRVTEALPRDIQQALMQSLT